MPPMETKHPAHMIEMTSGSLWKNIFLFSIPLMFSQILEVLFNLSDVAIAGKFAGYLALGSVGSTTLLVSLFTGFLLGLGSGINVRTAHELGVGDREAISNTIHSALLISLITGFVTCFACLFFARPMLGLLGTKAELMDGAVTYLQIYALGMPAMGIYNCGNGILSACGDTRRPLYYLTIAGILNVILNLFFVIVLHMAAAGVAIASVIAQYLSALLILRNLLRRTDACRLHPAKLRFHGPSCRAILLIGIPTGIQNALFAIANLFVQVGVNSFDAVMVSGNSAAANADTLIYNVMAAFHTACASFVSRNLGAGNRSRIMKSYLISLTYSFVSAAIMGTLLFKRASRHRRRDAADRYYGHELCGQCFYGLHHCRLPRAWEEHSAHGDRHYGFLHFPHHLGLYDFRPFPYHSISVSPVCLFMGHHCRCGNFLLYSLLPKDHASHGCIKIACAASKQHTLFTAPLPVSAVSPFWAYTIIPPHPPAPIQWGSTARSL